MVDRSLRTVPCVVGVAVPGPSLAPDRSPRGGTLRLSDRPGGDDRYGVRGLSRFGMWI
jgi:hypothetical protein